VLTIAGAAEHLGLTRNTVNTYRRLGRFPAEDGWRGRRPVWRPETLDAWQQERWAQAGRRGYAYPRTTGRP